MQSDHKKSTHASEASLLSLKGLLSEQLGRIHDGEAHLASEVPRFAERATSPRLKTFLRDWLVEMQEDDRHLKEIAKALAVPVFEGTSRAIRSAVEHERELLAKSPAGSICDSAIVEHGIQELEHQLSGYEAAAGYAHELGESSSAEQLRKILSLKSARLNGFRILRESGDTHFESFPISRARR